MTRAYAAEARKFATPPRRRQFLHGRMLAHRLLGPGRWAIDAGPDGRPRALAADGRPGPCLSISHSGRYAAAAAAEVGVVGIDVEVARHRRDCLALAEAYLSGNERRMVAAEGETAFLAFWTMREALAKMRGGGVSEALSLNGIAFPQGRNAAIAAADWVVAHRERGGLQVAVAWSAPSLPSGAAERLGAALESALENLRSR